MPGCVYWGIKNLFNAHFLDLGNSAVFRTVWIYDTWIYDWVPLSAGRIPQSCLMFYLPSYPAWKQWHALADVQSVAPDSLPVFWSDCIKQTRPPAAGRRAGPPSLTLTPGKVHTTLPMPLAAATAVTYFCWLKIELWRKLTVSTEIKYKW